MQSDSPPPNEKVSEFLRKLEEATRLSKPGSNYGSEFDHISSGEDPCWDVPEESPGVSPRSVSPGTKDSGASDQWVEPAFVVPKSLAPSPVPVSPKSMVGTDLPEEETKPPPIHSQSQSTTGKPTTGTPSREPTPCPPTCQTHYSNTLPHDSQAFAIGLEHFVIPKSILAVSSDELHNLSLTAEGHPVPLDCSAEAFRIFVNVIFNPWTSCLVQDDPSLKDVLLVLQIASKYDANDILRRARPIAIRMTREKFIKTHLRPDLTASDVFRIANECRVDWIAQNAWELILKSFRSGSIKARELLDEGQASGLKKYMVSAYYEVMLTGRANWGIDLTLSAVERQNLTLGMLGCFEEWDAFVSRLSTGPLGISSPLSATMIPLPCSPSQTTTPPMSPIPARLRFFGDDYRALDPSPPPEAKRPTCQHHRRSQYYAELGIISQLYAIDRVQPYDILRKLHLITDDIDRPKPPDSDWDVPMFPIHYCNPCWSNVVDCARETIPYVQGRLSQYFLAPSEASHAQLFP